MRWRYERWVKLYVREEGSFGQLPLYVRALAAELLKICDEDGRIALRGKQPHEAIAFQLGADQGDRRLLRKHIPILVADGYLVADGDSLIVRNFTFAQTGVDRMPVASQTRPERESDASGTRPERESDASGTRAVHESEASPTRLVHESDTRSELTAQDCESSSRSINRSEERREREGEERPLSDPAEVLRRARRAMAERAVAALNETRRQVAAKHGIAGVLDLPSQTRDAIQMRLAEEADVAVAAEQLQAALTCLEAEADESGSVEFLSAKSFEPRAWRALVSTTPDAARDRARRRRDADRAGPRGSRDAGAGEIRKVRDLSPPPWAKAGGAA